MSMKCNDLFIKTYKKKPDDIAFCPYRICPLGAHIDHNLGKILGMAIDKGIYIAYAPKHNGVIELSSVNFDKRAQWHIDNVPENKENDWADYLRGATIMLSKKHKLSVGLSGVIEGEIPIGGLSSSAAVIICFLSALCKLNNIKLTQSEMIYIAKQAENEYVKVSCGKLDQSCEVLCKKDSLLYLDTKDDTYKLIKTPKNMKPYVIMIIYSGVSRSLISSKYNMRQDEMRSAAYELKALANLPYGKYNETNLRDVPFSVFEKYKEKLPKPFYLRALHFYSEMQRVELGAKAYKKGDIEEFGRLVNESGYSSIYNYESGSPELKKIYEITKETNGVYGSRFSGAGFKGCCIALVEPKKVESVKKALKKEYLKAFPKYKDSFEIFICKSANGVKL